MPKRDTGPAPMPTLPPAGSATAGPAPIGVPDDYLAPAPRMSPEDQARAADAGVSWLGSVPVAPTFYEGDEIGFLFSMNPAALAELQAQLTAAGLLDPDSYQPGFVGGASSDPTVDAIRVVMSYGNRAGYRSVSDALRAYTQSGFGAVGAKDYEGARNARLAAPVSSGEDLHRVFRAAVIDTLGTGWSDADIDAMVADYQAHERAFNGRVAAGEAVDESLPTPETFAEQRAVAADPTRAQGQDFLEVANDLSSMIGRWGG